MKFLSAFLLFIAPISLALPTSVIERPVEDSIEARQCYVQCGSTCYTSSQVTAARNSGYNYVRQGSTAGGSTYPHRYNNYEGFDFLVSGPYYEFPLRTSGVYTGGSPGADRVVFNGSGQRAGEITHTGADGSAFVACSGW
ncbi:Ribonuclease/ribotoxin [Massariosphaeria phaeospora]|uniref:ribonuclease T1 n=1 Tax=Massariosphaeria phaeospora TaxID=100035 RepID=A0A7C8I8R3_9PLEO|nr:Ribonuclease/ribotoxin [Massariosphaeria phaeospora]